MARSRPGDPKLAALHRHHAINPRPQDVSDEAFAAGNPFFDARDLVQVKYEMLRRVGQESQSVTRAAAAFGFSRPSFYAAQRMYNEGGLPALLPQRPGPKRAHKLNEAAVDTIEAALADNPSLSSAQLVQLLQERLGVTAHRRSVERALARRRKKGLHPPAS